MDAPHRNVISVEHIVDDRSIRLVVNQIERELFAFRIAVDLKERLAEARDQLRIVRLPGISLGQRRRRFGRLLIQKCDVPLDAPPVVGIGTLGEKLAGDLVQLLIHLAAGFRALQIRHQENVGQARIHIFAAPEQRCRFHQCAECRRSVAKLQFGQTQAVIGLAIARILLQRFTILQGCRFVAFLLKKPVAGCNKRLCFSTAAGACNYRGKDCDRKATLQFRPGQAGYFEYT